MSGGKQTTTTEIPEWQREWIEKSLQRRADASDMGNMPFHGMDVAALSDSSVAGMRNISDMAKAFGLKSGGDPFSRIPTPQTNSMGMKGYSTGLLADEAIAEMEKLYPGIAEYRKSFTIDPVTGELGSRAYGASDSNADDGDSGDGTIKEFRSPRHPNEIVDKHGKFLREREDGDHLLPMYSGS